MTLFGCTYKKTSFAGITAQSEYGGTDGGYLDQVIITEELSRACSSVGLSYIAHSNLCVGQIHRNCNRDQGKKYLPKVSLGSKKPKLMIKCLLKVMYRSACWRSCNVRTKFWIRCGVVAITSREKRWSLRSKWDKVLDH